MSMWHGNSYFTFKCWAFEKKRKLVLPWISLGRIKGNLFWKTSRKYLVPNMLLMSSLKFSVVRLSTDGGESLKGVVGGLDLWWPHRLCLEFELSPKSNGYNLMVTPSICISEKFNIGMQSWSIIKMKSIVFYKLLWRLNENKYTKKAVTTMVLRNVHFLYIFFLTPKNPGSQTGSLEIHIYPEIVFGPPNHYIICSAFFKKVCGHTSYWHIHMCRKIKIACLGNGQKFWL